MPQLGQTVVYTRHEDYTFLPDQTAGLVNALNGDGTVNLVVFAPGRDDFTVENVAMDGSGGPHTAASVYADSALASAQQAATPAAPAAPAQTTQTAAAPVAPATTDATATTTTAPAAPAAG